MPTIDVVRGNGELVELDPPVEATDRVDDVRKRVGARLKVYPKQVVLFWDLSGDTSQELEKELRDGYTLAAASLGAVTHITVVLLPCQARQEEYESYIVRDVTSFLKVDYIRCESGDLVKSAGTGYNRWGMGEAIPVEKRFDPLVFPNPGQDDIKINMMPFIIGDKESIPAEYSQYWPLISRCNLPEDEHGKIGYLTIHESVVRKGETQRRRGLHMDCPGASKHGGGKYDKRLYWGHGRVHNDLSRVTGGIYMASNVPQSCKIWNVQIRDPSVLGGALGDLEHLRDVLGDGQFMEPLTMYWLTDVTPHECLPVEDDTYRQYFRLVTSSVSVWYPMHSTANRLGIVPDPSITQIIEGSKFDEVSE